MTLIVFCGPTISATEVASVLPQARVLAPASCGDIYRASRDEGLLAVGLVDGYFDHHLSVWHKEILWALHRGARVYGAASMGALRAAELEPFGMIGVGRIFEHFRAGILEDDDEVAVVHDEATRAYAMRSDAMVNLRATLTEAVAGGVISEEAKAKLVLGLKALFYPQRSRQALARLARQLLPNDEASAFSNFIETRGIVDQKRLDALEMLAQMKTDLQDMDPRQRAGSRPRPFEYTNAWHVLRESVEREVVEEAAPSRGPARQKTVRAPEPVSIAQPSEGSLSSGPACDVNAMALLERVRAEDPETYAAVLMEAVERAFALVLAESAAASVDAGTAQVESERFRHERGLLTSEQMVDWLAQHGMSVPEFSVLIYENALYARFSEAVRQATLRQISNVLTHRGMLF